MHTNPEVYFESHFVPSSELTFAVFLSQLSEGGVVLINDIMTLLEPPTFLSNIPEVFEISNAPLKG